MLFYKSIVVVVAVESDKIERVIRLSQSMSEHLSSFKVEFDVLVFDHRKDKELESLLAVTDINVFCRSFGFLPIVDSRNKCQSHLARRMDNENSIGMILDDDLIWNLEEDLFLKLLELLLQEKTDMAIMGLDGDSPIPKEYVRASPLLDFIITNQNQQSSCATLKYLSNVTIGPRITNNSHHDYYSFNKHCFFPCEYTMDRDDFVEKLYLGKATTRSQDVVGSIVASSGRERGGATLVLNRNVLSVPNISIEVAGYISRRSDMVMGVNSSKLGFNIHCTPPVLCHEREDSFDSHNPKKVISDILGFSYVESLVSSLDFLDILNERIGRSLYILEETNTMLLIISESHNLSRKSHHYVNLMLEENQETILKIEEFRIKSYRDLVPKKMTAG
jgi:hypothetical protein